MEIVPDGAQSPAAIAGLSRSESASRRARYWTIADKALTPERLGQDLHQRAVIVHAQNRSGHGGPSSGPIVRSRSVAEGKSPRTGHIAGGYVHEIVGLCIDIHLYAGVGERLDKGGLEVLSGAH